MDLQNKDNIFDIKYVIKVIVEDLTTGDFIEFKKTVVKKDIELSLIPREIDKRDVTLYVEDKINEYCLKNDISPDNLFVDGYEILSDNEGINIYFSVDDMDSFSLEPSVMAMLDNTRSRPVLEGKQIDDNTILWSWEWKDNIEYTSILSDFSTERTIAHNPINVSHFIESGIEQNTVVTRVVTVKKGDTEISSIPISMNVAPNARSSVFRKFEVPKRNENYKLHNMNVATRLKAFQSGVGDDNDCLIVKSDDLKYTKKFKLINKLYGIRASSTIRYSTVKFFYRFMMKGKVNYMGYEGSFKLRARMIGVPNISEEPTDETIGSWIEMTVPREYHFNDKCFVADIAMGDLFDELERNYHNRMKFEIEMYDINGSLEVYNKELGVNQIVSVTNERLSFEIKGYYDTMLRVKSIPTLKEKDYVEVYPPEPYEPLVGSVNGDFEMSDNGKKDMIAWCTEFDVPDVVFDKKYYCLIEHDKTNPNVADVQYKFDNQIEDEDYTETEGDRLIFSCDTIIEDVTEYREFITQIDRGGYVINDNRKHSYRYKVDVNNINKDRYKRFEIDVISNINDIAVLSQDVEFLSVNDNRISAELYVQVRSLQNAIARWSPYIHSGYYYYNQEERFLYNKSNINGAEVIMEQFCYDSEVSVNIIFHIRGGEGEKEEYAFALFEKQDLNTNPSRFDFDGSLLWPKPTYIHDSFPNYLAEYVYYTKPFVCPKEPTDILSIDWTEITSEFTSLDCYIITYNDVYGEWREPILLQRGDAIPSSVKPSKIMMLKFIARPSLRPQIRRREYVINCEASWQDLVDSDLTYNAYFKEDVVKQRSKYTEARVVSKLYDLGDTLEDAKSRKIAVNTSDITNDGIKIYFQESSDLDNTFEKYNANNWLEMALNTEYSVDRFVRFKIIIKNQNVLKFLKLTVDRYEYTDMSKEEYLPAFGNIRVRQEYDPDNVVKTVEHTVSTTLPFDKLDHVLVDNMKLLGDSLGTDQNFNSNDIVKVDFIPIGMHSGDYDIIYQRTSKEPVLVDRPLLIQSKEFIENQEIKENNQEGVVIKPTMGRNIKVSPIPQQFSPIVIQEEIDNNIIPYRQVYFIDDEGYYTLTNVEVFESLGFKTLYLQEYNIDETMLTVRINGQIVNNFKIEDNIIIFDNEVPAGDEVSATYRIKNSFIAFYDYENDMVEIELHGESFLHLVKSVRMFYETDKESSMRKLEHISLNPIYNPLYNGYIYISDKPNNPFKVTVIPADNMIYANGVDTMNVLVYVEDKDQNPVSGVHVNAKAGLGKLNKDQLVTDINGIAKFVYTSWTGDCVDKIKVSVTDSIVGESDIINRRVIKD